jgi:hypothetical protein
VCVFPGMARDQAYLAMEIYIGIILANQQEQFTVWVVPGIVDRCELPRGSQENVESYLNDEICSFIFMQC